MAELPEIPDGNATAAERAERFDAPAFLATLSRKPGVYRMLDSAGSTLYVGKARNLKNRVSSYFRASGLATKTMAMVSKIADVQITITNSETEALLLEQSLIKQERPPYNVTLRDDKSYPFIYLTADADYPRLTFHRGSKRRKGRYFGPYPSASAVRKSLNILQKLFLIRQCDDAFFRNRSRPCLQYQIQRCSAPCVGFIEPKEYQQDVELSVLFLEGRDQVVLDTFKARMEEAAQNLEFERAAKYRDQIAQLRKVQEQQYVHSEVGDVDVFALASASGLYCIQALFLRAGRILGQRTWYPANELGLDDDEFLEAFVSQYYFGGAQRDWPRSVITTHALQDAEAMGQALADRVGHKVDFAHQVRGQRARWRQLAQDNAQHSLAAYRANKRNVFSRFVALQEALQLEDMPERLECFDISHTMGEATVASCVVFDTEGPLTSDYRRFNIEGITGGDDYAAMEQALRRRYTRLKQGEGKFPDILVIDGGKGQLEQARSVLEDLQIDSVTLLGIAKGPTRKAGFEKFFLPDGEVSVPTGGAQELLQHIRDEAHRFAITGHRNRRAKRRTQSELDGIPGVGPKRKKDLLTHFGGLKGLKGASREEIAKVSGINQKLAEEIYGTLHAE
ncbi:MAG: excinuclease ABC subunit UvrC [Pseudomonadota bacterium]